MERNDNFVLLILSKTWGNLVFILGCVYFLYLTGKVPLMQPEGQFPVTVWPRFMLIALIVAIGGKTVETILKLSMERGRAVKAPSEWDGIKKKELAVTACFLVSLPILWEVIGFALANLVFMASFLYFGGERKRWKIALIAVISTTALLYLFLSVVYIDLPTGMGFMEDITRFIYRVLHVF